MVTKGNVKFKKGDIVVYENRKSSPHKFIVTGVPGDKEYDKVGFAASNRGMTMDNLSNGLPAWEFQSVMQHARKNSHKKGK